MFTTDLQNSYL